MGISSAITQATLASATPLLLAALGENIVQKAGIVNVGLEGMLLVGAFAATLGTLYLPGFGGGAPMHNAYAGIVAGAVAGLLLALLFAVFAVKLAANQIVVGVVINLFALGLTGTLYRKLFGTTGQFISTAALPRYAWLGNQTLVTLLACVSVPAVYLWLTRTRGGLALRACGEQPTAALASGIRVTRVRAFALAFGGAMAGLAGGFLSVGDTNTFIPNMSAGRGFIALAIVTAGRWNPVGCLIAALCFGFAQSLQYQGQALGRNLPYQLFLALPYLATLLILAQSKRGHIAPAALGRPYHRA